MTELHFFIVTLVDLDMKISEGVRVLFTFSFPKNLIYVVPQKTRVHITKSSTFPSCAKQDELGCIFVKNKSTM